MKVFFPNSGYACLQGKTSKVTSQCGSRREPMKTQEKHPTCTEAATGKQKKDKTGIIVLRSFRYHSKDRGEGSGEQVAEMETAIYTFKAQNLQPPLPVYMCLISVPAVLPGCMASVLCRTYLCKQFGFCLPVCEMIQIKFTRNNMSTKTHLTKIA